MSHTLSLRCSESVPGLPPGTLSFFRISVREAVLYSDPQQSSKSPPSSFPLHHLSEGRRCESFHRRPLRTVSAGLPRRSAAHRSGAGGAQRKAANRRAEERRRAVGGRTDCLPSNRRDYTLQHPVASTCLWGVRDSLGLLRWSPRCCSAPVGQVEKVSGSVRFLGSRAGCWERCFWLKGNPKVYYCTKTSLAVRVGVACANKWVEGRLLIVCRRINLLLQKENWNMLQYLYWSILILAYSRPIGLQLDIVFIID